MKALLRTIVLIVMPFGLALAETDLEVQKSVNNEFPMPGEPVEFTIVINNIGEQLATNVVIFDRLPPEMAMPAGTAAFPSIGDYDPADGNWTIGDMNAGDSATLIVPAVVTAQPAPRCIVNTATSEFAADIFGDNDESRAAIRQNNDDHCVDVSGFANIYTWSAFIVGCDGRSSYLGTVDVRNSGPDAARDMRVSLTQAPVIGARIRFDDVRCLQTGTAECVVSEIAAGETLGLSITSDTFQNYNAANYHLTVTASTSDVDYAPENDFSETDVFMDGFSTCQDIDIGIGFGELGPSGCFIATAAYGSPLDPHLDTLRNFRDRFLLTNSPGRAFVSFYYRYSPPMADFIADRDWLRAIVRTLLTPVVYAIEYPWYAAAAMLLAFTLLRTRRRSMVRDAELRSGQAGGR
jgi:uncharacterized repeat protein (TIGR01451 family)